MPQRQQTQTERTRTGSKMLSRSGKVACYAVLVLVGILIGAVIGTPHRADAGVRKGPQHDAFLSGGARSEKVLRDIAVIVARMDGRMANIEKAISQAAKGGRK